MENYYIGVDIGGTTVKNGLFTSEGVFVDKWEIDTDRSENGKNILGNVATSIYCKLEEKGIGADKVLGVGIGCPAAIDDEGNIVGRSPNLGWSNMNIPQEFKKYFNVKTIALNDANAAAYGEYAQGSAKSYNSVCLVTLGTGVGGGIVINNTVINGFCGAGGEIGHIHINDEETVKCGCGKCGCLEQYASATGIAKIATRRLAESDAESVMREKEINARTVFDAVKDDDKIAIETACEFGDYLGKGLAAIAAVVNPEAFVIGGGVSKAGQTLLDFIVPAFRKYAYGPCSNAKIILAKLGNDAGIIGACEAVKRKIDGKQ